MWKDFYYRLISRNKCVYGKDSWYTEVTCVEPAEKMPDKIKILLDNGHAKSTCGKCSPDGSFREYEFNRDIVRRISEKLNSYGITNHIIVPEVEKDIALSERARRANVYCDKYGKDNCLFISVHSNASGCGNWMNANGWSVWTTKGKTKSDEYADIFWKEANKILKKENISMRKDCSDGDYDYEENFTVIYKTKCPAILTENLFMDNMKDCEFLKTERGRELIAQIHVNAILEIEKSAR